MRDRDQVVPRHALVRMPAHRGIAVAVFDRLDRAFQIVRGDFDQRFLYFARSARRRAAEHDRHAAADRAVRRQRLQRIRAHDADAGRVAFEHFADDGRNQRLMALARRRRAHDAGDRARQIDAHHARIHPRRGVVLRIEQWLESRIAAVGLEARRDADAGEFARAARVVALFHQRGIVDRSERLVEHRVVIAGIVGRTARDQVRKLILAYEVFAAHLDRVHIEMARHAIDRPFEREIGRRLAETAHRFFGRLVGQHRDGFVLDGGDAVRSADRGDRLAELERRAARVRADVVQRADFERAQRAVIVERHLHVENAVGAVHVAAAHVLEPVFDQAHRHAETFGEIAHEHRVLDAALDSVTAADVDVEMHAHRVAGQAQRARRLIGEFRHLDRGPDVEHLAVPHPTAPRRRRFRSARWSCVPTPRAMTACAWRARTLPRPAPTRSACAESRSSRAPDARAVRHPWPRVPDRSRAAWVRIRLRPVRPRPPRWRACRRPPRRPIRRRNARRLSRARNASTFGASTPIASASVAAQNSSPVST